MKTKRTDALDIKATGICHGNVCNYFATTVLRPLPVW